MYQYMEYPAWSKIRQVATVGGGGGTPSGATDWGGKQYQARDSDHKTQHQVGAGGGFVGSYASTLPRNCWDHLPTGYEPYQGDSHSIHYRIQDMVKGAGEKVHGLGSHCLSIGIRVADWRHVGIWYKCGKFHNHGGVEALVHCWYIHAPHQPIKGSLDGSGPTVSPSRDGVAASRQTQHLPGKTLVLVQWGLDDHHF